MLVLKGLGHSRHKKLPDVFQVFYPKLGVGTAVEPQAFAIIWDAYSSTEVIFTATRWVRQAHVDRVAIGTTFHQRRKELLQTILCREDLLVQRLSRDMRDP